MPEAQRYITRFAIRWKLLLVAEALLVAAGVATGSWFYTRNTMLAGGIFILLFGIVLFFRRPWRISNRTVIEFLDTRLDVLEYSTGLLAVPYDSLSVMARLQQRRIGELINRLDLSKIFPPNHLGRALVIALVSMTAGWILPSVSENISDMPDRQVVPMTVEKDSVDDPFPVITNAVIDINYPSYTGKAAATSDELSLDILEGSTLTWRLELSGPVDSIFLQMEGGNEKLFAMNQAGMHSLRWQPGSNTLYSFRLVKNGQKAISDIYFIHLLPDQAPQIMPRDMMDFVEFAPEVTNPSISITAEVTDDFGVTDAYVVATVTKGAGESVKFREEILRFPQSINNDSQVSLIKMVYLDSLNMTPGDELYYYIEAVDNREPIPRKARSETFFAILADTLAQEYMTGGAMSVDLMPDYFRSQRQIIIDTEALLARKPAMDATEFKQESNALGYDQKLLRIKYGQYLGDEFESGVTENEETLEAVTEEDPDAGPTAAYTHDHDHEEHVALENKEEEDDHEDPLSAFMHEHSDPEEATLYSQGVRAMLKQALAEMWDAELYLRLYEPDKSLPYQYKALDLIQKIKNQARIYVHRIGFDPPPIKEDSRLTGELDEIENPSQRREEAGTDPYAAIRLSMYWLEEARRGMYPPAGTRNSVFVPAADEVAAMAIENPGKYLKALTSLRLISQIDWKDIPWDKVADPLLLELADLLPKAAIVPGSTNERIGDPLDSLYLMNLEGRAYE